MSDKHKHEACEESKCGSGGCDCGQESAPADVIQMTEAEAKRDKKAKQKAKDHEHDTKLKAAQEKAKENHDLYLRTMAEFDNFRKRTAKEKQNVYSDAIQEMVSVLLPLVDNFERALNAEVCTEEGIALKAGVEMIFKQMFEIFQKLGVKEIETDGVTFDPNLHEAVSHIEDEAYGEQEIAEVFQKGYRLNDKVIRHSMVKVAN